jgi:Fe2+ transport system protein FeoA
MTLQTLKVGEGMISLFAVSSFHIKTRKEPEVGYHQLELFYYDASFNLKHYTCTSISLAPLREIAQEIIDRGLLISCEKLTSSPNFITLLSRINVASEQAKKDDERKFKKMAELMHSDEMIKKRIKEFDMEADREAEIVKKTSAPDTLKRIAKGKTVTIRNRDIKEISVRAAVSRLNRQGYYFIVTSHGLADEVKVTRTK